MFERLKRWWARRLCRWEGHDDEQLWREVLPLLPPARPPEPVAVPEGLHIRVAGLDYDLDSYEIELMRCRRCGRHREHAGLVRTKPPRERVQYVMLPEDRWHEDEQGRLWRKER